MRRLVLVFTSLALILSGCNVGQTENIDIVLDALDRIENSERRYVYTEVLAEDGTETVVEGTVEDDLRYHAKASVNDDPIYEQIVSDDALAIRILDNSKIPSVDAIAALTGSQVIGDLLRSGDWVLDHGAAPPLNPPLTSEGTIAIGVNPVLDASYFVEYIRRSIDEGSGVWKWNEEDLFVYNDFYGGKTGDPFEPAARDSGLARYDVLPPGLPARSERGTQSALPGAAEFRKMAIYIKDGLVIRVTEFIDIVSRIEFVRAQEGRAGSSQYHLELMRLALQGQTRDPVRLRRVDYTIRLDEDASVQIPDTDKLTTGLEGVFGEQGFSPLPETQAASGQ